MTVDGTTIVLIPLSSPVYKNADWPIFVTVTPLIDAGITTFSTEKSNPVISPLLDSNADATVGVGVAAAGPVPAASAVTLRPVNRDRICLLYTSDAADD